MNYKISIKASEDIENIWLYTYKNWSLEQADRYVDLIFDEIEYLSANPKSGKNLSHIRKNYYNSKIKSHIIFYRIAEKGIEIIRVLHQRMDSEDRLKD
jgi:toxin ParE1/3/4